LRRQCQREGLASSPGGAGEGVTGNGGGGGGGRNRADSTSSTNQNGTTNGGLSGGASIISKTRNNGTNSSSSNNQTRSQSLTRPLMDSVDCDLNSGCGGGAGPMFAASSSSRMDPTTRWEEQQQQLMFNAATMRPCSVASQLGWPVGEPPPHINPSSVMAPLLPLPPPSSVGVNMTMSQQQSLDAGLITPPYTMTDSSLELRSPDIIPPPVIGACDFGPATLPRSAYKGLFEMAPSASSSSTMNKNHKPHVTWSDTMPKVFRQSHEFLRRETSSSGGSSSIAHNKRESVV
jgi:hypothetical protein